MNNIKLLFNLAILLYFLLILIKNNIIIQFNFLFKKIEISLWLIIFISFSAGCLFVIFNNMTKKKKKKNIKNKEIKNEENKENK